MLESLSKKDFGANEYGPAVIEQWSTYAEMAERNTEKRLSANNLYITINLALLAVVTAEQAGTAQKNILSVLGIIICFLWRKSILSYRMLSSVKYHVLNDMEKHLPMAPFKEEWSRLKKEKEQDNKNRKKQYVKLTSLENRLPIIIGILYAAVIVLPVVIKQG